ncbi:MAG: ABC transporter permease subunit [Planctomycetes bacterium]|nr:ABC transporter permease subunit [Planctomycetota bacterium]
MLATLSIARNTLSETLRQSVFGVVLLGAGFLIASSPAFSMFTFMDSTKLVQDMGLATILIAGLFLAVLCSITVISKEIEGRTALTVLAKPISRGSFVLGKFLGISAAIILATCILIVVLLLTFRFGVKDAGYIHLNWDAMIGVILATLVAIFIGVADNYFFGRPFMTTAIWSSAATFTLCLLFFCLRYENGEFITTIKDFGSDINWQIAIAGLLTMEAILIMTAITVAISTRGNAVAGIIACATFFSGGMLSEYFFGRFTEVSIWAKAAYTLFPNLQIYWVTESQLKFAKYYTELINPTIPFDYVAMSTLYAFLYICAILLFALVLFERREVRE